MHGIDRWVTARLVGCDGWTPTDNINRSCGATTAQVSSNPFQTYGHKTITSKKDVAKIWASNLFHDIDLMIQIDRSNITQTSRLNKQK